jgi:hypothetical protein
MNLTRQDDHYAIRLADDLLNCCENKMADFLKPVQFPYYAQDMFTSRALTGAGQLKTLLDNASRGTQFINFAPTFMIQDSKKEWFKNIKKDTKEIGSIVYKGKDENGNKHYEMMSPAGKFNPGINENPMTQDPVPNVGICRNEPVLNPRDPKGIEKYLTDVIGNYFNAAFTKTPYFPPQWGSRETEMLSKALNADPSLAIRTSQQAFSQATSVKMENTVNQELNDNVREAMKQGLPPFNTKKQDEVIGPVNINNGNSVPANGVDFINSYYNNLKGKSGAEQGDTTVTQNGYIPYQTHEEKPKNIDKFLVEEYGNIMNASLTGTPYSGSVTPAQLKTLSSGIEAKMANDPAYMSGIVNQAHQNVLGFYYMPYDKDDFITRAQDPSSREFKMLNETIEKHLNDIIKNKKMSFNGEFQELSKDLAEKRKKEIAANEAKKPPARATRTAAANAEKKPSTRATRTTAAKKEENVSAAADTAKSTAKAATAKAATPGTSAANKAPAPAASQAAHEVKRPPTRTATGRANKRNIYRGMPSEQGHPSASADTVHREERPFINPDTQKTEEKPLVDPNTQNTGDRPSFAREVTEFVKKHIIDKKPSLVLVDTFLGTVVDKARKIVRTGRTIAAAFVIATNVLAPSLQMPTVAHMSKITPPNAVTISVNQNDFKSAAQSTVKAGGQVRQAAHHARSAARR